MDFGDEVRQRRRRLGITQQELADRTGLSVRGVRDIEANRVRMPRPATVRRLADALGLHGVDRGRFHDSAGAPSPDLPPVPAQLPADLPTFSGRTAQLAQLDGLLAGGPATVVISAIAGTAGVGKTALAVHWAHRVKDRFPGGQLYVNLRGFDPTGSPMSPAEAVRGFIDAFQVPPWRIPAELDAQVDLYRGLLAGRRVLVVLDNAREAEQVRPLLPGPSGAGSLALVTSRSDLTGLLAAGARPVTLDLLTTDQARRLLTRRLGRHRTAAEPEAVDQIIARCARLPLALTVVAARAAVHPHFPLAALAGELRDVRTRLDVLDSGEAATDVRAVFSWSYRHLSARAAGLFRLVGLHPGPDLTVPAAASLVGLPAAQVRPLLAELTGAHLVTEPAPGRYACHDLLRMYATELTGVLDPEAERRAALHRLLDSYLHTALRADRLLDPHRDPLTPDPPQPGVSTEDFTDPAAALAWFAAERRVLLAVIDRAAGAGFDTHTCQLAWAMETFFDLRGHWPDWATTQQAALTATRRLADRAGQATAHRVLGRVYTRLGRFDDALAHFRPALDLFVELADRANQARTHLGLTVALDRQGRYPEALDHARRALDLHRAAGHRVGQAIALNAVGWIHTMLGDYRQALHDGEQALAIHQQTGYRVGEANTWDSLGFAHHHLGDHQQAVTCYQQALDLLRAAGDRYTEAQVLNHLGDAYEATGDTRAARIARQQATDILTELGDRRG